MCVGGGGKVVYDSCLGLVPGFYNKPFLFTIQFHERLWNLYFLFLTAIIPHLFKKRKKKRRGQSGKLLGYTGHIVLDCHYYHPLELVPHAQKPQILISTGITGGPHHRQAGCSRSGQDLRFSVSHSLWVMLMLLVCVAAYCMVPCHTRQHLTDHGKMEAKIFKLSFVWKQSIC